MEVAADWHELVVPRRGMQPSGVRGQCLNARSSKTSGLEWTLDSERGLMAYVLVDTTNMVYNYK